MKNKTLISKLLLFSLVASFLLQLRHSFEHFILQEDEICLHESDSSSKKQITHAHELAEQCKVCSFSISSCTESSFGGFNTNSFISEPFYSFFKNNQNIPFFKGSLFALRAPPIAL